MLSSAENCSLVVGICLLVARTNPIIPPSTMRTILHWPRFTLAPQLILWQNVCSNPLYRRLGFMTHQNVQRPVSTIHWLHTWVKCHRSEWCVASNRNDCKSRLKKTMCSLLAPLCCAFFQKMKGVRVHKRTNPESFSNASSISNLPLNPQRIKSFWNPRFEGIGFYQLSRIIGNLIQSTTGPNREIVCFIDRFRILISDVF